MILGSDCGAASTPRAPNAASFGSTLAVIGIAGHFLPRLEREAPGNVAIRM
jgi:hypothetical protein